jgi:NDP-sugar pyrophosphorylase family protein
MKAMILAAGLGTRLRPLTNYQPKAMVEVNGMPLLEIVIRRLKYFGFDDIIINVHHFADQITNFLEKKNNFDVNITISDERDKILETGGGLKKAAPFFKKEPFLLCNTDILCDIDLRKMYDTHLKSEALATLAVRKRETSRYLIFNESNVLHGWMNVQSGEIKIFRNSKGLFKMLAFSGIHIVNTKIFDLMNQKEGTFSIIDIYLEAIQNHRIIGFQHDDGLWLDVGKRDSLEEAAKIIDQIPLAK